MPRFCRIARTVRRCLRTRRIKYMVLSFACVLAMVFVYVYREPLKKFVPAITRPLWDTPDGNFTKIDANVYPAITADEERARCENNKWRFHEVHMQPRVIDAVIFSNEIDILEIRIRELWDVVDKFVILESNRTFTGHPKPCFFQIHRSRFQFAASKIVTSHVTTLTPLKHGQNPFDNETEMRRQMNRFLWSSWDVGLRAGDLLIISDVDEIPRKEIISLLKTCTGWPNPIMLEMITYVYSFEFTSFHYVWRPKVRRIEPEDFDVYTRARSSNDLLKDAGWHCSFCFRYIEEFIFKMQAYSHADRVTNQKLLERDAIQWKICNGKDIFDMYPEEFEWGKLISNLWGAHQADRRTDLPQWVLRNPDKFGFLLPGGCSRIAQNNM